MRKFFKVIAILVLVLALAVVALLAVGPSLLPIKSMITEAMEQQTGRKVTLEEASLSILGGIEFSLAGLNIAEKPAYGQRPMVKLKKAAVRVQFLPLLASHLIVDELLVDGLEVSLARGKNGVLNFADRPAREDKKIEPAPGEGGKGGKSGKGGFAVLKAAVTNSTLFLANLANGAQSSLPLETCTLAAWQAKGEVAVDTAIKMPGLNLVVRPIDTATRGGDAQVSLDLDMAEIGKRLAVAAPGLKMAGRIEARLEAAGQKSNLATSGFVSVRNLLVAHPALAGRSLNLADARLDLDLASESANVTTVKRFTLVSHAAGLNVNASGKLATATGHWDKTNLAYRQSVDLARLARSFAAFFPKGARLSGMAEKTVAITGEGPNALKLAGNTLFNNLSWFAPGMEAPFQEPRARLDFDLSLKQAGEALLIRRLFLDGKAANLGISGMVAGLGGNQQKLDLKIDGNLLNLDAFSALAGPAPGGPATPAQPAPAPAKAAKPTSGGGGGGGAKPTSGGGGGGGGGAPAQNPAAVALANSLATINAKVVWGLRRVIFAGSDILDLRGELLVKDRAVVIDKLTAKPYDGSLTFNASLDAKPAEPVSKLALDVQGVRMTPALFRRLRKQLPMFKMPINSLSGVVFMKADLTTRGLSPEAAKRNLTGTSSLLMRDGVTIGLDWLDKIEGMAGGWGRSLTSRIPRKFAKLDGQFKMDRGKLDFLVNLLGASGKVDSLLKGTSNLLTDQLDAQMILAGHVLGKELQGFLAPDGTFPIALGGTIGNPRPKVKLELKNLAPAKGLLERLFK